MRVLCLVVRMCVFAWVIFRVGVGTCRSESFSFRRCLFEYCLRKWVRVDG